MTCKRIAAELKRLDREWQKAPALPLDKSAAAQRALANYVAENLEAITAKLES